MSKFEMAFIGTRLLAIVALVFFVVPQVSIFLLMEVQNVFSSQLFEQPLLTVFYSIFPALINLILIVLLWKKAALIANKIISE